MQRKMQQKVTNVNSHAVYKLYGSCPNLSLPQLKYEEQLSILVAQWNTDTFITQSSTTVTKYYCRFSISLSSQE